MITVIRWHCSAMARAMWLVVAPEPMKTTSFSAMRPATVRAMRSRSAMRMPMRSFTGGS